MHTATSFQSVACSCVRFARSVRHSQGRQPLHATCHWDDVLPLCCRLRALATQAPLTLINSLFVRRCSEAFQFGQSCFVRISSRCAVVSKHCNASSHAEYSCCPQVYRRLEHTRQREAYCHLSGLSCRSALQTVLHNPALGWTFSSDWFSVRCSQGQPAEQWQALLKMISMTLTSLQ